MPLCASLKVALGLLATSFTSNISTKFHSGEFSLFCPQGNILILLKARYTDFKEFLSSISVNPITNKNKASLAWLALSKLTLFPLLCACKPSVSPSDATDCTPYLPVQRL